MTIRSQFPYSHILCWTMLGVVLACLPPATLLAQPHENKEPETECREFSPDYALQIKYWPGFIEEQESPVIVRDTNNETLYFRITPDTKMDTCFRVKIQSNRPGEKLTLSVNEQNFTFIQKNGNIEETSHPGAGPWIPQPRLESDRIWLIPISVLYTRAGLCVTQKSPSLGGTLYHTIDIFAPQTAPGLAKPECRKNTISKIPAAPHEPLKSQTAKKDPEPHVSGISTHSLPFHLSRHDPQKSLSVSLRYINDTSDSGRNADSKNSENRTLMTFDFEHTNARFGTVKTTQHFVGDIDTWHKSRVLDMRTAYLINEYPNHTMTLGDQSSLVSPLTMHYTRTISYSRKQPLAMPLNRQQENILLIGAMTRDQTLLPHDRLVGVYGKRFFHRMGSQSDFTLKANLGTASDTERTESEARRYRNHFFSVEGQWYRHGAPNETTPAVHTRQTMINWELATSLTRTSQRLAQGQAIQVDGMFQDPDYRDRGNDVRNSLRKKISFSCSKISNDYHTFGSYLTPDVNKCHMRIDWRYAPELPGLRMEYINARVGRTRTTRFPVSLTIEDKGLFGWNLLERLHGNIRIANIYERKIRTPADSLSASTRTRFAGNIYAVSFSPYDISKNGKEPRRSEWPTLKRLLLPFYQMTLGLNFEHKRFLGDNAVSSIRNHSFSSEFRMFSDHSLQIITYHNKYADSLLDGVDDGVKIYRGTQYKLSHRSRHGARSLYYNVRFLRSDQPELNQLNRSSNDRKAWDIDISLRSANKETPRKIALRFHREYYRASIDKLFSLEYYIQSH